MNALDLFYDEALKSFEEERVKNREVAECGLEKAME